VAKPIGDHSAIGTFRTTDGSVIAIYQTYR